MGLGREIFCAPKMFIDRSTSQMLGRLDLSGYIEPAQAYGDTGVMSDRYRWGFEAPSFASGHGVDSEVFGLCLMRNPFESKGHCVGFSSSSCLFTIFQVVTWLDPTNTIDVHLYIGNLLRRKVLLTPFLVIWSLWLPT
jgi:hypothetical protein